MCAQVALLAIGAAMAAFRVLVDTSTAADIDSELREALEQRGGAEPLPPDPPRLLPAVHVLWAPLMSALRVRKAPSLRLTQWRTTHRQRLL